MKNTIENKQKFFAQYWGQKVLKYGFVDWNSFNHERISNYTMTYVVNNHEDASFDSFLKLTPLSQITDEDARNLGFRDAAHFKIDGNEHTRKDELRLMGYAVEWCGLEVEQQIEYGWIKL